MPHFNLQKTKKEYERNSNITGFFQKVIELIRVCCLQASLSHIRMKNQIHTKYM